MFQEETWEALPSLCLRAPTSKHTGQRKNPRRSQAPTPDTRLSRSWAILGICILMCLKAPPWWTLERIGAHVLPSRLSLIVYECPERAKLMVFSSFLMDLVSRSWV